MVVFVMVVMVVVVVVVIVVGEDVGDILDDWSSCS